MVSEGARPWGRGRSEFAKFVRSPKSRDYARLQDEPFLRAPKSLVNGDFFLRLKQAKNDPSGGCLTPPVANPGAAERAPWLSTKRGVARVSSLLEIPTNSCHFPRTSDPRLVAPYRTILRYYRCDTPYRAILCSTPPKWCDAPPLVLSFTQGHLCDTPFCNVSRDNCAISHKNKHERL